jgi:hypothetical protein
MLPDAKRFTSMQRYLTGDTDEAASACEMGCLYLPA